MKKKQKKYLDFFQKLFCQESVKDPPKVISKKASGPYLDQEAKIGNFSPGWARASAFVSSDSFFKNDHFYIGCRSLSQSGGPQKANFSPGWARDSPFAPLDSSLKNDHFYIGFRTLSRPGGLRPNPKIFGVGTPQFLEAEFFGAKKIKGVGVFLNFMKKILMDPF